MYVCMHACICACGCASACACICFSGSPGAPQCSVSSFHSATVHACSPQVWATETGDLLHTLRGHQKEIVCLAFSPQGDLIATGSMDHTAKLWDVETGIELCTLVGTSEVSVNASLPSSIRCSSSRVCAHVAQGIPPRSFRCTLIRRAIGSSLAASTTLHASGTCTRVNVCLSWQVTVVKYQPRNITMRVIWPLHVRYLRIYTLHSFLRVLRFAWY